MVVNMNLRKIRGQEAGYFELCPAIMYEDLEKMVAELEGKKQKKGWPTAAANIGNLRPHRAYLEWPITITTDIVALGQIISNDITEYAVPFWNSFSSLNELIKGYEVEDPRLTLIGNSYKWKMIAAYCLIGNREKAKNILEKWENGRPPEITLKRANEIISKIS